MSATTHVDVLVIGAGPAGLAAADRAAQAGLRVLIIDENTRAGGQISRLPFRGAPSPIESLREGIEFRGRTQCLGFLGDRTVAIDREGIGSIVRARAVLVATGSTERVYPIPGWTKPGVMTAGAGQTFLKGSGRFPYRRVVVAGTGPLLLAAASQLVEAGVEVVAVVEATMPRPTQALSFLRVLSGRSILLEGAAYVARLLGARTRILPGRAVTAIEGDRSVTGVRISRVDRDWEVRPGRDRLIGCDAVLFSQGFSSSLDLTAQAGADIAWNELMQTWEPVRDTDLRTSVPGVWAAGDCAGIGGSKIAAFEGELAGAAIAAELTGERTDERRIARVRRDLARLARFRRGMDEVFRVGAEVPELAADTTIVCRCQETTAGEIRAAVDAGCGSLQGVKLWTRAGMGICQGRTCSPLIEAIVTGRVADPRSVLREAPRPRFPVRPASARVLQAISLEAETEPQPIETHKEKTP